MTDPLGGEEPTARQVAELIGAVIDLKKTVEQDVQPRIGEVEYTQAKTKTRLLAVLLGVLLFVAALAMWNRVTLQQAQERAQADVTAAVVDCFLRPGAIDQERAAECSARFGSLYAKQQVDSATAIKQFTSLQEWATEHGWKPPPPPEG